LSGQFDWELFLMTATALSDFAKRLDQTAEDTEALLGTLLSDALLPDEIMRPKRLIEAIPRFTRPMMTPPRSWPATRY
jgi:hypothetical protein